MNQQLIDDSVFIKRFLKFQKIHKVVPLTLPIQQSFEPVAYKLIIERVVGLKRPSNPSLDLQLSINANFFIMSQQDTMDKCFFGRTYQSPRVTLNFGADGMSYEHPQIEIFYHTRIEQNKENPLLIVLEMQIYESQQDLVLKRQHVGWTEIQALQLTQVPVKLSLRRGSPRVIMLSQQIQFEEKGFTLLCEVMKSNDFQICQHLIPENALCGMGDEVPGLNSQFIGTDFSLSRSLIVYMSNIQVMVPDSLEAEIYKHVQKYRKYKYKTSDEYTTNIQITSKKLVVAYHNGWTFVNSRGTNNFVPLGETRMFITENVEGKTIQFRQLVYQGVIDINNICNTDPQSNTGMLVVQLEYESTFQINTVNKETISLCLGWVPIYINNKFGSDEIIDEDFIIGQGKSLDNKQLVQFNSLESCIKIRASLNLAGTQLQAQDLMQRTQNQQAPSQIGSRQFDQEYQQQRKPVQQQIKTQQFNQQNKTYQKEDDMRTQIKLKDYQIQLDRLQEENENLRRLAQQSHQNSEKQVEYAKMIEDLRNQNQMMQFTQSKQFQGLEKLIKEQQQVTHQTAPRLIESKPDLGGARMLDTYAYPVQSNVKNLKGTAEGMLLTKALIEMGDDVDNESRTLRQEEDDERRDSVIVIQATSIKQINHQEQACCKSIYLTVNFYDFPTYRTPHLKLEYSDDDRNFKYHIQSGNPLRLLYNQEPFNIKFMIETSTKRYQDLFVNFFRYLYHKYLIIDVWDSESMILYGTVRMPIRGLLRQGKQSSNIMNEVDIIDPITQQKKGSLQMLIRHIGKIGNQQQNTSPNKTLNKTAPAFGLTKSKIVSEKPINRDVVPITETISGADRIKQRINKIKQQNIAHLPKTASKEAQLKTLHEVQKFKEQRKGTFVKTIVDGFMTNEKILQAFYGQSEVVPFDFKNSQSIPQEFLISIEDPDSRYLDYSEFFIVSNAGEWKYWANIRQYPEPSTYDKVKTKEIQGRQVFYFVLDPYEEITLIFKFLSFRLIDPNVYNSSLDTNSNPEYKKKYMNLRNISVFIQQIDGKMVDGLRVIIQPHNQIIDHILRFYERDNRQTRLNLPQIFPQPSNSRPRLHVTESSVLVEWSQDNNLIRLNYKVGDICTLKSFNIIVYGDMFQHEILGNWKIEVHSLCGFDVKVPLGQMVSTKLALPSDIHRVTKLSSKNPKLIQFPSPFNKEVGLIPGKVNLIPIQILALKEGQQNQIVTCVDIYAMELIYSWMVSINTEAQPPSQVYELKCMDGYESRHQITYMSHYNYVIQFNLISSSEYATILDPLLSVGPQETVNFKIRILPKCETEIKIFLNDVEERIFDTILLKIKYVY